MLRLRAVHERHAVDQPRVVADGAVDKSRYWLLYGEDFLEPLDVDHTDIVQTIESNQIWEHLGIFLNCHLCSKLVGSHCYHCDTCGDFTICPACYGTRSWRLVQTQSHPNHKFVHILYRPIEAPLYDGSDLEILEAFAQVSTEKKFYLYYPFVFHDVDGMDVFAYNNKAALREAFRKDSFLSLSPTIMDTLNFPTDWFVRVYGRGAWEPLHRSTMALVGKNRMFTARISQVLSDLLTALAQIRQNKIQAYGHGDIPPTASGVSYARRFLSDFKDMGRYTRFLAYTAPLQMTADFNPEIKQEELLAVLPSDETIQTQIAWEAFRPMRMLLALFQDNVTSEHWKIRTYAVADRPFILKPEWIERMDTIMQIRHLCSTFAYDCLPCVSYRNLLALRMVLGSPSAIATRRLTSTPWKQLATARRLRKRTAYDAAEKILKSITGIPGPAVAFELQLVFEDQGYFNRDDECIAIMNSLPAVSSDGVESLRSTSREILLQRSLVDLVCKYHECFSQGKWLAAIAAAQAVFRDFLELWIVQNEFQAAAMLYLEIYYHRIIIAAYRDQNMLIDYAAPMARLDDIRLALQGVEYISEALDLVQLQLELGKKSWRAQYFDEDASFSVTAYGHRSELAHRLLPPFLMLPCFHDADARNLDFARGLLMSVEVMIDIGGLEESAEYLSAAKKLFAKESSVAGVLDARILSLATKGSLQYSEIKVTYDQLRLRKDIGRLRILRKLRPLTHIDGVKDVDAMTWLDAQRVDYEKLAFEAGDNISGYRWRLRKYSADFMSGSLIANAESVLASCKVPLSGVLSTIASFNLANAHHTIGNTRDAVLYAVLHESLTGAGEDAERSQRALLLVTKTLGPAFSVIPRDEQVSVWKKLSKIWNGCLSGHAMRRWSNGAGRCDEIERFIDGACFLPRLAGQMARDRDRADFDRAIACSSLTYLKLAFGLFAALPIYLCSILAPRLALALGAVAEYAQNSELACRAYQEALQLCHSGDVMYIAALRVEAGKSLTRLTALDPEHWHHVLRIGRSLLISAGEDFLKNHSFAGAIVQHLEAQLALVKSYVDEARGLKRFFERGLPRESQRESEGEESSERDKEVNAGKLRMEALLRIRKLQEKADAIFHGVRYLLYRLREDVRVSSRYEKMRSLRFVHSGLLARETFDRVCEIAWIGTIFYQENLEDPSCFGFLWGLIQARKATVLQEETQAFQSAALLQKIRDNPDAWKLYRQEQRLIQEGKQNVSDHRLYHHRDRMEEIPELKQLLELRYVHGANFKTLEALRELACFSSNAEEDVILVDWAQYGKMYFIIGYDLKRQKICFGELLPHPSVYDTRLWVAKNLKPRDGDVRDLLDNETVLASLHSLVEPISRYVKPGSLLIFSPAQVLHFIPLHAIPLHDPEDFPVIYHHPVVYCASAANLVNVVEHSLEPRRGGFRAALHGRYSTGQSARDDEIATALNDITNRLQEAGATTTFASGSKVNHSIIQTNLETSHLFHFHGHADGELLGQHLQVNSAPDQDQASPTHFNLQDVFTISMPASVVLLVACASGTQDIASNDDALGLVTAFFAAGATSVLGTLWPIDSVDGLEFTSCFYDQSFLRSKDSRKEREKFNGRSLIDLARAHQAAVLALRRSNNPMCGDDEYERQMDPREPWRWAGYVLQGSWVCQDPQDDGHE